MKIFRHILSLQPSLIIFFLVFMMSCENGHDTIKEDSFSEKKSGGVSALKLYETASGLHHERLSTRINAAKKLSVHPDGRPFIVLLCISSQTGDDTEQRGQLRTHNFELAVVVAVLQTIPKDVDSSVLLALTYLLEEKEKGYWSKEDGLILKKKKNYISPPIRELARECLRDRIGVDHGWDILAWRTAIINRKGCPESKFSK